MIVKDPQPQEFGIAKPAILDDESSNSAAPVVMRMPPKRMSTLRVHYVNKGKGQPRVYRLDD